MDRFYVRNPLMGWRGHGYEIDAPDFQGEFAGDLYGDPSLARVNLNNASLPAPSAEVAGLVMDFQARLANTPLTEAAYQDLAAEARAALAPLLGMEAGDVIFGRNTTEAMHWEYWLAQNCDRGRVVMTFTECPSIYRMACYHLDHGNPDRKDPLTTYFKGSEASTYEPVVPVQKHRSQDVIAAEIGGDADAVWIQGVSDHFRRELEGFEDQLPLPRVIFSHVFRHDGRALDIKGFTEAWRALGGSHITIDGAMALGNLPKINMRDLGVNGYGVSPHKTLGTLPLGAMLVRRDTEHWAAGLADLKAIGEAYPVFTGFFPPEWDVRTNTESKLNPVRFFALSAAIKDLRDNQLIIGEGDCTPYPENFHGERAAAIECKERTIAKTLMERGFAFTFLRRGKIFRLSFSHRTTEKEISEFFDALEEVLNKK